MKFDYYKVENKDEVLELLDKGYILKADELVRVIPVVEEEGDGKYALIGIEKLHLLSRESFADRYKLWLKGDPLSFVFGCCYKKWIKKKELSLKEKEDLYKKGYILSNQALMSLASEEFLQFDLVIAKEMFEECLKEWVPEEK